MKLKVNVLSLGMGVSEFIYYTLQNWDSGIYWRNITNHVQNNLERNLQFYLKKSRDHEILGPKEEFLWNSKMHFFKKKVLD